MFNTVLEHTNYLHVSNLVHGLICLTVYLSIGQLKSDNSAGNTDLLVRIGRSGRTRHDGRDLVTVRSEDDLEGSHSRCKENKGQFHQHAYKQLLCAQMLSRSTSTVCVRDRDVHKQ